MQVGTLAYPLLVEAMPHESLDVIAERLAYNDVGSAAVFDSGRFAGIITERDIIRALADRCDLARTRVEDYMSDEVATVTPETDARDAAADMLQIGVRHLPVVDRGKLVGIVSIRDLLVCRL